MLMQTASSKRQRRHGQAAVEFALTLPILVFIIMGIIDASRLFFAHAQATHSLRESLRYAEILGVLGSGQPRYLDCAGMEDTATQNFFTASQTVEIQYIKASDPSQTYTCATVTDAVLETGDMLRITVDTVIRPVFMPFGDINIDVYGQRTIIKEIQIGLGADDEDSDGLHDTWENTYFGNISSYGSTDDPDMDGCNNGCEEDAGTDPTDSGDYAAGINNDRDNDGILNAVDNCPVVPNPGQENADGDNLGNVCDPTPTGDDDNDGVDNSTDTCPGVADKHKDTDHDGIDDACDPDIDGDGFDNAADYCPSIPEATQTDGDGDGVGNACDNCPTTSNASQADTDGDGIGNACDSDPDGDGIGAGDSCPNDKNTGNDDDGDGIDNVCDPDIDGDGRPNETDNCPIHNNNDQADLDNDGVGNKCDNDVDGDGIENTFDPCPMQPANNCANGNANVTIYLQQDNGSCNFVTSQNYQGKQVNVRNTQGSPHYSTSTSGNQGKAQFSNLTTGQSYTVQVPNNINGYTPKYVRVGSSGECLTGGTNFIIYGLSTSLEIWVGYKNN